MYNCTRSCANTFQAPVSIPATVTSNENPFHTASDTGGITTPLLPGSLPVSTGPTATKKLVGTGLYVKKLGQKVFYGVFLVLALILIS